MIALNAKGFCDKRSNTHCQQGIIGRPYKNLNVQANIIYSLYYGNGAQPATRLWPKLKLLAIVCVGKAKNRLVHPEHKKPPINCLTGGFLCF